MTLSLICAFHPLLIITQERTESLEGGRLRSIYGEGILFFYIHVRGQSLRPLIASQLDHIPLESEHVLLLVLEVIIVNVREPLFCLRIWYNRKRMTCGDRQRLFWKSLMGPYH